ncbi:MAG: hypothetical protein NXI04_28900 [Planctomycetaceae bacterium]|nr:hypothetical protein [Planctomycetaceae bacterium]
MSIENAFDDQQDAVTTTNVDVVRFHVFFSSSAFYFNWKLSIPNRKVRGNIESVLFRESSTKLGRIDAEPVGPPFEEFSVSGHVTPSPVYATYIRGTWHPDQLELSDAFQLDFVSGNHTSIQKLRLEVWRKNGDRGSLEVTGTDLEHDPLAILFSKLNW